MLTLLADADEQQAAGGRQAPTPARAAQLHAAAGWHPDVQEHLSHAVT
jgi:hypothetical protein